jgi:hypothetical protein
MKISGKYLSRAGIKRQRLYRTGTVATAVLEVQIADLI